jgi:hypothetical protein
MKEDKRKQGRPVKWTEDKAIELANELIEWLKEDENIWFERFLYEVRGLYPQIISEMGEKYNSFSEAIKRAKKIQESKIVDYAFKNDINTTMAIFVLKNTYNWTDKVEQQITIQEQPLFGDDEE